jgi:hypothetical protein
MKTRLVNYERRNKEVFSKRSTIDYIAKSANTKQEAVNRLSEILSGLKLGFGGSHVWCANQKDERLFIIYF